MMKTNYEFDKDLNKSIAYSGLYTIGGIKYYFYNDVLVDTRTVSYLVEEELNCMVEEYGYSRKAANIAKYLISLEEKLEWVTDRSCICNYRTYNVGDNSWGYVPGREGDRIYNADNYDLNHQVANLLWKVESALCLDNFMFELDGYSEVYIFGGYSDTDMDQEELDNIKKWADKHLISDKDRAYLKSLEETDELKSYWEDYADAEKTNETEEHFGTSY